jgi:twitching motility protein PilT
MAQYQDELNELVGQLNQRASAREEKRFSPSATAGGSPQLVAILATAIEIGASDVLLVSGTSAAYRVNGRVRIGPAPPLGEEDVKTMVQPYLTAERLAVLQKQKSVDFSFEYHTYRFRANVHHQRGKYAAALRLLPNEVPTLSSLELPSQVAQLCTLRRGLVLVTGPTGSGKSSTLAAMVDEINRTRECHIVTLEEPIEFVHASRKAVVEQIEVGMDTPAFQDCLRSLLRQSADVILVGEMRDPETVALALTAAETGHLILSSLHTNDAAQSISRIVDSAPASSQQQVRLQLSLCLEAIVTQNLVAPPEADRRFAACEILLGSDAIRNLIRQRQDHQIRSQIHMSRASGMRTMEAALLDLVRAGKIQPETALAHSFRLDEMRALLEGRIH